MVEIQVCEIPLFDSENDETDINFDVNTEEEANIDTIFKVNIVPRPYIDTFIRTKLIKKFSSESKDTH